MALSLQGPETVPTVMTPPPSRPAAPHPAANRPRARILSLPPSEQSAKAARAFTREMLALWHVVSACDNAELIVNELVTNAVSHAEDTITLSLAVVGNVVHIEVVDDSVLMPTERSGTAIGGGSYGLLLVASLARDWGTERHASGGKTIWADIVVPT